MSRKLHAEKALWNAVIIQALFDAIGSNKVLQRSAYHWLTSLSEDFKEVWYLAGHEPTYVRRKAVLALLDTRWWNLCRS